MFSDLIEATNEQTFEVFENFTLNAIHDVYILLSQLEWCSLKVDATRSILKHEAEINMNDSTTTINENVTIVTIFHIEHIIVQTVTGQAFYEILLCFLKVVQKVFFIESSECPLFTGCSFREFLFERINTDGVWYELNHT